MENKYILDACALLAWFDKEPGYETIESIISQARQNKAEVFVNKLNLLEVYYNIYRVDGFDTAFEFFKNTMESTNIKIINGISDEAFLTAGRIKAQYKISFADSILLGEAITLNASVVTSDHHEFDTIEKKENLKITWFR